MKHATIPVFVPHLACPNDCVFCNQKKIAGIEKPIDNVHEYIQNSLKDISSKFSEVDIAFFGGSFTGIERSEMERYLSYAKDFLENGNIITGIRLSTRPDYINYEILDVLKSYGVTAIELGAQSFCDDVLSLSKRGHASETTKEASRIIKEYGFELVLQLMPGLPGDTRETILHTAETACRLNPDGVRIYPCVVIKDTELEQEYLNGKFIPLSVDKAVSICADLTLKFKESNIKILRTGLHSSDLVQNQGVVAGPFHPAFGELVTQKIYLDKIDRLLSKLDLTGKPKCVLSVSIGCISKVIGQNKKNIKVLEEKYKLSFKIIESEHLSKDNYEIDITLE